MAGLNLNFGTSVLKREAKPIEQVDSRLQNANWTLVDSVAGGRVKYYEKAGISITAVSGPLGTVIMPSGPVRGAIFGENAVSFNTTSSIGAGSKSEEAKAPQPNPDQMV